MGGAPFGNNVSALPAKQTSGESDTKKSTLNSQYRIFNDEPEIKKLALNYDDYVETISNIILHSKPPYTVGIFGSWGTGKSSVMKNVQNKIEGKCEFLEFNAWRFEREENHATIPLLISIITTLWKKLKEENPSGLDKLDTKNVTLTKKIIGVLKGLAVNFKFGIPGFGELGIEYDGGKTAIAGSKQRSDIPKSTFHDGADLIVEMLKEKKPSPENENLKLIVFIDDLDRCTPEKAVEVFESVKVFLNFNNIVFVLALSQEIVEAAVDVKYGNFNKVFSGKDYLKKIVQLPVLLPMWNEHQIREFVEYVLNDYHDAELKDFLIKKKSLISKAVESNPREVIRLLNNFIFSKQIFKNTKIDGKNIDDEKLLAVCATRLRWPKFYEKIKDNPESMNIIKELIK